MRTILGTALALLLTSLPLAASADTSAGPPKPGKCSVAAEGVGATSVREAGLGFAFVAGAVLVAARARRSRRPR